MATPPVGESCGTCQFWIAGECRRDTAHSQADRLATVTGFRSWSPCDAADWCAYWNVPLAETLVGLSGAWDPYTPTFTTTVGVITTAVATGSYKIINKTCFFEAKLAIAVNGSGATAILLGLPALSAMKGTTFAARGAGGVYFSCAAFETSPVEIAITAYDGAYPGADLVDIYVAGTYELA